MQNIKLPEGTPIDFRILKSIKSSVRSQRSNSKRWFYEPSTIYYRWTPPPNSASQVNSWDLVKTGFKLQFKVERKHLGLLGYWSTSIGNDLSKPKGSSSSILTLVEAYSKIGYSFCSSLLSKSCCRLRFDYFTLDWWQTLGLKGVVNIPVRIVTHKATELLNYILSITELIRSIYRIINLLFDNLLHKPRVT